MTPVHLSIARFKHPAVTIVIKSSSSYTSPSFNTLVPVSVTVQPTNFQLVQICRLCNHADGLAASEQGSHQSHWMELNHRWFPTQSVGRAGALFTLHTLSHYDYCCWIYRIYRMDGWVVKWMYSMESPTDESVMQALETWINPWC